MGGFVWHVATALPPALMGGLPLGVLPNMAGAPTTYATVSAGWATSASSLTARRTYGRAPARALVAARAPYRRTSAASASRHAPRPKMARAPP
eukprot:5606965-Prymnesium_polylepis.1